MLVRKQKNRCFVNQKRVDKRWNGTSDATTGGRPARLAVSRRRQKNRLEDPARPAAVEEKCSTNATMAQYYELAASDVHVNNYVVLQELAAGFCDKSTVLLILVLTHHGNNLLRIATRQTWAKLSNQNKPEFVKSIQIPKFKVVFVVGKHRIALKNQRAKERT